MSEPTKREVAHGYVDKCFDDYKVFKERFGLQDDMKLYGYRVSFVGNLKKSVTNYFGTISVVETEGTQSEHNQIVDAIKAVYGDPSKTRVGECGGGVLLVASWENPLIMVDSFNVQGCRIVQKLEIENE